MANVHERIAQLEAALANIRALNEDFHAVKQIRAHAAEENQRTKTAIRNQISAVLAHKVN